MEELLVVARELWVVWLFLLFVGIVTWALWPSQKQRWEAAARIPFREDDGHGP